VVVRIGTLRTLVRLERPVVQANPYGDAQDRQYQTVVVTYASKKVATTGATEAQRFEMRISNYDVEWRLRYRGAFDPRWRLVEVTTGTVHDIIFASDPDGKRAEIVCRTRIANPQPETEAVP